ncbi:hemerythrin domain-containing protein [Nakamurella sp. A5-74]|uniref:Hemerythrin domain-containing protein n=1 Tax=Nakamurella sp. A5-74 TaxID=3158264 RepID=A0AAU8DSX4_9ACTN
MIGKLTMQHENITNHTTALRAAGRKDDRAAAAAAAAVLGELLHPHTRLEERGLFAEMRTDEMFTEHIDSLCAEHEVIDAELAAICGGDLSRVDPLLNLLANHIDREENGLFPAALVYLDDVHWDRLHEPETPDAGAVAAAHGHSHPHGVGHQHAQL